MDLLKHLMGGRQEKKEPLVMLRSDTGYMFFAKQFDDLEKEFEEKAKEMQETFKVKHQAIWHQITTKLKEDNLIKDKEEPLTLQDGVIFKYRQEK